VAAVGKGEIAANRDRMGKAVEVVEAAGAEVEPRPAA
jgi:hypothetical protein